MSWRSLRFLVLVALTALATSVWQGAAGMLPTLYSYILYYTILYYTILYYTILYYSYNCTITIYGPIMDPFI